MDRKEQTVSDAMGKRPRLAVCAVQPVHYQVDMIQRISRDVDPIVLYGSRTGLGPHVEAAFGDDPIDFGISVEGIPHEFLPQRWGTDPYNQRFAYNPGLVRRLREGNFDAVLVSGWGPMAEWNFLWSAIRAKVPLLLRSEASPRHAFGPKWAQTFKRAALRLLFPKVTAFLSIGSLNREFYLGLGVPAEKIFHVPYAVDNEFFVAASDKWRPSRKERLAALGLDPAIPTLLFSGKLIQRKRPLTALAVHETLLREGLRTNLVFLGNGPLRVELERQKAHKGLTNVYFWGFRKQQESPEVYSLGDIFLFPSGFETWGLVVNEAMCFGMPVVTTDMVAASVDLVKEGENGFVCGVDDVPALAAKTAQLVRDEGLRRMGERSLEIIRPWSFDADAEGLRKALGKSMAHRA